MDETELRLLYIVTVRRLVYLSDADFMRLGQDDLSYISAAMGPDGRPSGFEQFAAHFNEGALSGDVVGEEKPVKQAIQIPKESLEHPYDFGSAVAGELRSA